MTKPLTRVQAEVLVYLRRFHAEQDQLPPTHDIAERFGWASPNAASLHLLALARLGHIEKNAVGKYRFTRPKTAPEAACHPQ